MFCHEKAPHVAQHHQDVLVHGVDMEQVVLHLPHDAAEHPEVATQHRSLVHEPHGMGDARWLLKDAHEGLAVDRIAPEGGIHHRTGVVQRSQGARRTGFSSPPRSGRAKTFPESRAGLSGTDRRWPLQ